jgi:DNA-binding NtrC family response regulator
MIDSPTEGKPQALIIDEEQNVRALVSDVLRGDGWNVSQSPSPAHAVMRIGEAPWSVVFCNLRLGSANGYSALRTFKEKLPNTKVVLIGGHGKAGALDATAFGAYDYLLKPFGAEELRSLSQALREQMDRRQRSSPARRTAACPSDIDLVGRSQAFIEVLKCVSRVSSSSLPMLLIGESGTGKKLIASAIHQRSPRAARPFIAFNCSAVPADQIEKELFGYLRGSFNGADRDLRGLWEEADGGTIFLDQITETQPSFQSKLLRTMQVGEIRRAGSSHSTLVNVRVIAASNSRVDPEVAAGRFRHDLFQYLKAVSIVLPPLRERREDVPPLAQTFAERVYSLSAPVKFSAEALELLQRYDWPGNTRELENVVVRAVAACDGTVLAKDLPQRVRQYAGKGADKTNGSATTSESDDWVPLSRIEGRYVAKVLAHTRGNKQAAARVLGVDRKTLDRMIKRHHIETKALRARAKPPAIAANSMEHLS